MNTEKEREREGEDKTRVPYKEILLLGKEII